MSDNENKQCSRCGAGVGDGPDCCPPMEFKVTKLPPAYPDGSELAMRRWPNATLRQDGSGDGSFGGMKRHGQNKRRSDTLSPWAIGSDKHLDLLDLGGSLAEDTWGLSGNPYGVEQAAIATTQSGKKAAGGYHHHTQGETQSTEVATDREARSHRAT